MLIYIREGERERNPRKTHSLLRKKPPNIMTGMTMGGPIANAMATLLAMHEIIYPAR